MNSATRVASADTIFPAAIGSSSVTLSSTIDDSPSRCAATCVAANSLTSRCPSAAISADCSRLGVVARASTLLLMPSASVADFGAPEITCRRSEATDGSGRCASQDRCRRDRQEHAHQDDPQVGPHDAAEHLFDRHRRTLRPLPWSRHYVTFTFLVAELDRPTVSVTVTWTVYIPAAL